MLYMDNVQMINLEMLKKLPDLRYLTLMNMQYIPKHIYFKTNMYSKISTTNIFQIQEASESLTERYEKISTEVYQKSTTVLPIQISRFIPVSSNEISYFSQEMHSNAPSRFEFSTSGRDLGRNEIKSAFEKSKSHKFLWIISVAVCLTVILFTIKKGKQRGRGQIIDSDKPCWLYLKI